METASQAEFPEMEMEAETETAVAAAAEQEQETAPEMETAAGAAVPISARKATGGRSGKDIGKVTTRATRADSIPASDRSQCRSRMERPEAAAAITDR